jgi:hypothetical protein
MKSHEELAELVAELLERVGITYSGPINSDDWTAQDLANSLGGIEGYSYDFQAVTYVTLPEDVQELLLLMASAIYSDEDEDDFLSGEEE